MNKIVFGALLGLFIASVATAMVPRDDFTYDSIPSDESETRELIAKVEASVSKLDDSVKELIEESAWLVKN